MRFYKSCKIRDDLFEVGDILRVDTGYYYVVAISSSKKALWGSSGNDLRPMIWQISGLKDALNDDVSDVQKVIKSAKTPQDILTTKYHYISFVDLEQELPGRDYELIKQPTKEEIMQLAVLEAL